MDLTTDETIAHELLALCDRLAGRLQSAGHSGHTVTLKVRFADFTTITRSETTADAMRHTSELWGAAQRLLVRAERAERPVRLLGIGVSGLEAAAHPQQLTLESPPGAAAGEAAAEVRARFGEGSLIPARLLDRSETDHTGREPSSG